MTKEERKMILKQYRLNRKLRTTKREQDLSLYRRDFYKGAMYNVFVRNSQIYENGFTCIVQCQRTKRIVSRYEDWSLDEVFMTLTAWLNNTHRHAHTYGAKIDGHFDEFD